MYPVCSTGGHETARLCTALGMTVLGVDPRPEYDVTGVEIHPVAELDTLLPRADFVIVTTPHTPETEGMPPAAETADTSGARAIQVIGDWKIG